jgi:hypothetical protein
METFFNRNKAKTVKAETLAEEWKLNKQLSRKERKALVVIGSHAGKRAVFETYLSVDQQMAEKYLKFISQNPEARYVKWDKDRGRFME